MASGFPLNMQQLLPLLEVVGTTNKHLAKASTGRGKQQPASVLLLVCNEPQAPCVSPSLNASTAEGLGSV